MLFDVGIARAVVDAAVQERVAELGPSRAAGGRAAADPVAGARKARQPGRVDVKQGAGARPLIAPGRLARCRWPGREPVAVEHLPDRRARPAADPGQAPGAEAGLASRFENRLLLVDAHAPGLAPRA